MIVKIAHIADVHLRDRQYTYEARGLDFSKGFLNAINAAISNGANAIICAGDMLDTSRPSAKVVIDALIKANKLLEEANVKMFVISGNHDISKAAWADIFTAKDNPGIINLDWRDATVGDVTIKGYPFMHNTNIKAEMQKLRDSEEKYDIITWHGSLKEFVGYTHGDDIVSIQDFAGTCKLLALGDLHIHKSIEKCGMLVTYPGSTELCSESEDENKQLYMYTWEDRNLVNVESIPFATRPVQRFFIKTDLDLEDAVTKIKKDSIIFVKYLEEVKSTVPRLNTVLTPENILRPIMIPKITDDVGTLLDTADTEIISPVDFVKKNIGKVLNEEQEARIGELCYAMVDIGADHKYAIDKFCADKLEGKIIL